MSEIHGKKKALGRGLSALLQDSEADASPGETTSHFISGAATAIQINQIEANPFQPRTHFNESELAELAISIQQHGIIQPLTLRKTGPGKYQLIAGERRLKACKIAGLTEVPAYIRIANDEQMLEMALVENIQRQDLNPLEIAISFQRLLEECKIRQEDLSQKVGKDRSTISNYIRLLKLPTEVQVAVRDNLISMGHARAIITIEDEKNQLLILQRILEKRLSVRQVEEYVRKMTGGALLKREKHPGKMAFKHENARDQLKHRFQSKVEIKINARGAGSISIPFASEEDFDRIMAKLNA